MTADADGTSRVELANGSNPVWNPTAISPRRPIW